MTDAEHLIENVIYAMRRKQDGLAALDIPHNKAMLERVGISKEDMYAMAQHVVCTLYERFPDDPWMEWCIKHKYGTKGNHKMKNNAALVYIKEIDTFISIAEGCGDEEIVSENADAYLYINTYIFDLNYEEFVFQDGGSMEYNSSEVEYFDKDGTITSKAIEDTIHFMFDDNSYEYQIMKYYNH